MNDLNKEPHEAKEQIMSEETGASDDDLIELSIDRLVTGGDGIGRVDGRAVFVPLTAPGDQVLARVSQRRKKFWQAELIEVLTPGPERRPAPCPHFGDCGGCQWQHLPAQTQTQTRRDIVVDCFARLGRLDVKGILVPAVEVETPAESAAEAAAEAPAETPTGTAAGEYGFRDKIRLFASPTGHYGLRRRGSRDVVPLKTCALLPAAFDHDILPWLRILPPVEQIVIRFDDQGAWLCALKGEPTRLRVLKKILAELPPDTPPRPGCVGLLFNNMPVWGRDYLVVRIAGKSYRVSARSFFQTNLTVCEQVVQTCRAWLDEEQAVDPAQAGYEPRPLLGDLYCGVGLFSLALADRFAHVIAADIDAIAIRDARNNVDRNRLARERVEVHQLSAEAALQNPEHDWSAACVLLDPPRIGLGKEGIAALIKAAPREIIYLSCDPATLARDAAAIVASGYSLRRLQVMDMFPQSAHVESLLWLRREEPSA